MSHDTSIQSSKIILNYIDILGEFSHSIVVCIGYIVYFALLHNLCSELNISHLKLNSRVKFDKFALVSLGDSAKQAKMIWTVLEIVRE